MAVQVKKDCHDGDEDTHSTLVHQRPSGDASIAATASLTAGSRGRCRCRGGVGSTRAALTVVFGFGRIDKDAFFWTQWAPTMGTFTSDLLEPVGSGRPSWCAQR